MLDKPLAFVVLNFFCYLLVLLIGGFAMAFPVSVFFSVFIIIYNYKILGLKGGLTLAIIYLLAFDNEDFYFSEFNIRIWYFYLVIIYFILLVEFFRKKTKIILKKRNIVEYGLGFVFFLWSIYFLIIEDFVSKINNIKYWVFYIGLILVLNNFFSEKMKKYLYY